ncbi:hypothetical protein NC653_002272 [Populus alba x Populus x berolinensis]|uniref:Uncharacterized protein n=1 Tax=Populus alba x Populus x berolinensis TaxID=444605 RepID=A0AAD6WHM6_9ROSI|nr:hypothetical protein NC653_002272 [Populus alba x Populus x berolinensis]
MTFSSSFSPLPSSFLTSSSSSFHLPLSFVSLRLLNLTISMSLLLLKFHLNFQANGFLKGLPVAARLTLLYTIYLEYQHACIGSLEPRSIMAR